MLLSSQNMTCCRLKASTISTDELVKSSGKPVKHCNVGRVSVILKFLLINDFVMR